MYIYEYTCTGTSIILPKQIIFLVPNKNKYRIRDLSVVKYNLFMNGITFILSFTHIL